MLERYTLDSIKTDRFFLQLNFIPDTITAFHGSLIPWYLASMYDNILLPDSIGGRTIYIPGDNDDTIRVSLIYWANYTITFFSGDFNKALSLVTIHELGHQIAKLEHTGHISTDCIMQRTLNAAMIENYAPLFCPRYVAKFRSCTLPPRKVKSQSKGVVGW